MTSAGPLGFVPPAYQHASLPGVLPALAASLDVDLGGEHPAYELGMAPARRAVLVLLDGLGLELLRRRAGHAPFLRSLLPAVTELDCGFPTTTATSLTSLGTGMPPGEHGILGYELAHPETGRVFDHLSWEGGPDPLLWQPHPTVFEKLTAAGVEVTRIGLPYFDGSGLTQAGQRGGRFVGASSLSSTVRAAVRAATATQRAYVYVYWGAIDRAGHEFGCESPQWTESLEEADAALRRLAEQLPADTSLTITADHGMVDIPFADRLDLATDTELAAGVRAITHEARAPHVYCLPGAAAEVAERWRGRFGDAALVLTREQAVDEGWFGPVAARNVERIGDLVVAFGPGLAVQDSRTSKPVLLHLLGLHGSLTRDEVAVPLLHRPATL